MKQPRFSGPTTNQAVEAAINQDLANLGFVRGKEFIEGNRSSGRTTHLLKDALHQLDFMDPGDAIWVVARNWEEAKRLCEHVGNHLAEEMGFKLEDFLGPKHNVQRLQHSCRYFLAFQDDKHIHFCTVDSLSTQLLGRRLTYSPCIFIEHMCFEFGAIQDSEHDLYAILQECV